MKKNGPGERPDGQALATTAQRLLQAARTIIERDGYRDLSLKAVGAEANKYSSLVYY